MSRYLFTNKFKVGDRVICIRGNKRYPEAYIQPGDKGEVIEVEDGETYTVHKSGRPKNESCYMRECYIDFADVNKRQPEPTNVWPGCYPAGHTPVDQKVKRLKLIKTRAKIFKKQRAELLIEQDFNNYND